MSMNENDMETYLKKDRKKGSVCARVSPNLVKELDSMIPPGFPRSILIERILIEYVKVYKKRYDKEGLI